MKLIITDISNICDSGLIIPLAEFSKTAKYFYLNSNITVMCTNIVNLTINSISRNAPIGYEVLKIK